ncbi:MAG: very short patch repair endonuclease [Candidatus Geothermincolia bacterium]
MSDVFDPEKRSWIMSRVRGKDTKPEKTVRSAVHRMGYRFRLHEKNLPGHPDIVLPRHRKVIFVHGCFWHGHEGCKRSKLPTSNVEFWTEKIHRTRERDQAALELLEEQGWDILTVWQCQAKEAERLNGILDDFLSDGGREVGSQR